jgi:hypothetical protein
MTTGTEKAGLQLWPEIDELEIELLLDNSSRIDAEFAAIMIASGFCDRVIADTVSRPVGATPPTTPSRRRGNREFDRQRALPRVRSPPSRR